MPINPIVEGYHDASGYMCGGVVLPVLDMVPRVIQSQPRSALASRDPTFTNLIIWRSHLHVDMVRYMVSWGKPRGCIKKSDLEPAVRILHHDCFAECFDLQYHTTLACTDNV